MKQKGQGRLWEGSAESSHEWLYDKCQFFFALGGFLVKNELSMFN